MTDLDKMRTTIRVLCAYRGLNLAELAGALGWSRQRLNNRLVGNTPFTFEELHRMADILLVDPKVWFDEPENALKYVRTGSRPTPATAEVQPLPRSVAGDEDLAVAI